MDNVNMDDSISTKVKKEIQYDEDMQPLDYIVTKNKVEDIVKLEEEESTFGENYELDVMSKCEFKIEIEETDMKKECFGENDKTFSEDKDELVISYLKVESNVEGQSQSMLHNEENNESELKPEEEYPSQINEIQSEGSGSSTQNQLFIKKKPISNIKTHNCNVCNKSFTFKSLLDRHLRIHTGERPFTCTVCEFSFKRKSQLTSHMLTHNDKKPYVCDICQKDFIQKAKLVTHKLIHNGLKFTCDECNKSFLNKYTLIEHRRIHSGDVFTCDVCQETFTRKSKLDRHKLIHTGEKPYLCDLCGKAFNRKEHLTTHNRLHTGDTPYSCTVCNKSFAYTTSLYLHKQKCKH